MWAKCRAPIPRRTRPSSSSGPAISWRPRRFPNWPSKLLCTDELKYCGASLDSDNFRLKFDPNRPVRELSCDLPVTAPAAFLCLPEEKLLKKLASSVDEDTINFIKAKEQFKATLTFPGILFR